LLREKNELKSQREKILRERADAGVYAGLWQPFSAFHGTEHVDVQLGSVPLGIGEAFVQRLCERELCYGEIFCCDEERAVVLVICHRADAAPQEAGFSPCPFTGDETGEEHFAALCREERRLSEEIEARGEALFRLGEEIRPLKIYCDYLGVEAEKEALAHNLETTERTFLLDAFVPEGSEEDVRAALSAVTGAVYFEFTDPSEGEEVPTLLKNGPVASNFEAITNLYSPPSSREMDPNPVMSFFYSVFLGYIMADIGYGILMMLGGGYLWYKNRHRSGGVKSLAGVFAVGGVFTVIWGLLFNSLLGIQILPVTLMPDAQKDMWVFLGISMPSELVIALLIGVVQIFAGYLCKAAQCFRVGAVGDGIFGGLLWACFSAGVFLVILGGVEEFALSSLFSVGGITAVASLALAALTAGRKEKFFKKFTKGFGAVYGVINYASDVLSYARLYGLMLSGAVEETNVVVYPRGNWQWIMLICMPKPVTAWTPKGDTDSFSDALALASYGVIIDNAKSDMRSVTVCYDESFKGIFCKNAAYRIDRHKKRSCNCTWRFVVGNRRGRVFAGHAFARVDLGTDNLFRILQ